MFTSLLRGHYESCRRDFSNKLVNSVRSYINSKLDHEKKSPEFITELRRKLYCIHEYNSQVAKATHEYPWSRKLHLLLIKYVELEYDFLYSNYPSRQLELRTESKVLRLLQTILYPSVLTDETLITKTTDQTLKRAVLQILQEVKSSYLVKNKLINNITNKLRKKVYGLDFEVKNSVTSDYGTDDGDSDLEKDSSLTKDCVEVPVIENGCAPIPTVEFTDDDEYFVYLQRGPLKRKSQHDGKRARKRGSGSVKTGDTITICSDSEDEVKESVSKPVVTFEILDDDDDDQNNYMVYLQKEVTTKKKKKEVIKEVIICSDSEDEEDQSRQETTESLQHNLKEVSQSQSEETNEGSNLKKPSDVILASGEDFPTCDDLFQQVSNVNFLIDPSVIFEQEKNDTQEDCRLNESLLEELLSDDNYLLEGRKEFEELEYFLFNDSPDKQGSFLANISMDDDDAVQPETFDADMNCLESFLDDSQLINLNESGVYCANSKAIGKQVDVR